MMNNDAPASLNYEAEYERVSHEFKMMKEKNNVLHEELVIRDRKLQWLYGFKYAVETIFGKDEAKFDD